ncbi:MAG: GxxExxY protein [Candidatus Cloacimonetes bacterium]|nr:GxxExxY protein [Candidatus Cloacimonadota bacterium]
MKKVRAEEYPESTLTGKIIGAAIEVHKKLGPGFVEKVYQRALSTELRKSGLKFKSQAKTDILYKGGSVGFQAIDFIIENKCC